MSSYKKRRTVRTLILTALAVAAVSCAAVFFTVSAADGQTPASASDVSSEAAADGTQENVVVIEDGAEGKNYRFKPNAVYNGSLRSELLDDELPIYDAMYEHCITNPSDDAIVIDYSSYGYTSGDEDLVEDMIKTAYTAFSYDHPEAFWICSYSSSIKVIDGLITQLKINLLESYPDAFDDIAIVNSGIASAVSDIRSSRGSTSRYDTAKAIHDYICDNVTYDYDVLQTGDYAEDQTAAPLFGGGRRGKTFVCEGYSESFKLLCDRFGIPCVHVVGHGHAWNYMQMDNGKWYAVDVTWDDNDRHPPLYTYFLIGSNTKGFGGTTFKSNHIEEYSIFYYGTINPFAYPELSSYAYYVGHPVTLSKTNLSFTVTDSAPMPSATLTARKPSDISKVIWYSDQPEIASVTDKGKVTALAPGTARIYCKSEDGEILSAPCVVDVKMFMIDTSSLYGCSSYAVVNKVNCLAMNSASRLDIMDSESTGEPVVWKSSNAAVVNIGQNGYFSCGSRKGTVTVTATRGSLKTTTRIRVYQPTESLSLNYTDFWIHEGRTTSMKAFMSKGADDPVIWESLDESVATVNDRGVVKGVSQGSTRIRATTASGMVREASVLIRSKAVTFAWSTVPAGMTPRSSVNYGIAVDATKDLYAVITSPSGSNDTITWTTSNKAVVSIENILGGGNGVRVKGLKKGTSSITAKTGSGKRVTYKITVVPDPMEAITLNRQNVVLYAGASASVTARVLPRGCNDVVMWKSSDSGVATVDESGRITGVSYGDATVTAYSAFSGTPVETVGVHVMTKATGFTWGTIPDGMTPRSTVKYALHLYDSKELSAVITAPANCNDTITWTVSNKSVLSMTNVGGNQNKVSVTALKKGNATVTARTGSGKRITYTISVVEDVEPDILLGKHAATVYKGSSITLPTTVTPRGSLVLWRSSDPSVATVDENGRITAVANGTATITAYPAYSSGSYYYDEAEITVLTKATSIRVLYNSIYMWEGDYVVNVAEITPAGCGDTITWTSSNPSVATVGPSTGVEVLISGISPGRCTITARTGSGKTQKIQVWVF